MATSADVNSSLIGTIFGSVAALLTVVISKRMDNSNTDRRTSAHNRRKQDQQLRAECAQLREWNIRLETMLIAKGIPLPPMPRALNAGINITLERSDEDGQ